MQSELPPAMQSRLDAFFDYLRFERNLSKQTLSSYAQQLATICESLSLSAWSELDTDEVKSILSRARRAGLAPRSIALRLSALRTFCDYLVMQGELPSNPAKAVQSPKQGRPLPQQLNVDEINQLLEIPPETPLAIRDRAMMELTYGCGLRLAELAGLNVNDFQRDGQLRVWGKGSKERLLPVGRTAQQWLAQWLTVRPGFVEGDDPAMFLSKHKRRISTRQIAKRMKLWANKQHLAQSVNPHKLRHSYATHMLESSGDLRAVQELLGHANLSTTQVYTHLDFQHLAKVYDNAHPRARKTK